MTGPAQSPTEKVTLRMTVNQGFVFIPMGGVGEFGANFNLYGFNGKWLIVDFGIGFPDQGTFATDILLPDPGFIIEHRADLLGMIITHAHEDHIGAVPYFLDELRCPVYASPFAHAFLKRKLTETGADRAAKLHVLEPSNTLELGPFTLEFIAMTHSIPEPNLLVIGTDSGAVLHTGDWKIDETPLVGEPSDLDRIKRLKDEPILAVISDSTNIFQEQWSGSESEAYENLLQAVQEVENGRVLVTCFSSNISRIDSLFKVAAASGRKPCVVGRSLQRMVECAQECGYIDKTQEMITERTAASLPPEKVLYISTGSQGEPRSALARISGNNHPTVRLEPGDTVLFSSKVIPGNEKAVGRMQNRLARLGVQVVSTKQRSIHVSGHPSREEMKTFYDWIQPPLVIPVHGEDRHLIEHAAFARASGVPQTLEIENGDVVQLAPGPAAIIDRLETGKFGLDGTRLVNLRSSLWVERRKLFYNGIIILSLLIEKDVDEEFELQVHTHGIQDNLSTTDIDDALFAFLEDRLMEYEELPGPDEVEKEEILIEFLKKETRKKMYRDYGVKPLVDVCVFTR